MAALPFGVALRYILVAISLYLSVAPQQRDETMWFQSKAFQPVLVWHTYGLLVLLFLAPGCGTNLGPIAETAHDVNRLPVSTQSLRARSLPDSDISSLTRLHELTGLDFSGGMVVEGAKVNR